ncbi:MAG: NAD(P)-dependent oxidoreductase, partial [Spirochaetales bacterium]
MDNWQIVFLDAATVGDDVDISGLEEFGTVTSYDYTSGAQTVERIGNADIVVTNKVKLGEAVFSACPEVKLVALTATGVNNIDLEAARKHSVAVANVAGYSTDSVAQHTFALLLSLLGRISYHDQYVKKGEYSRSGTFTHLKHPFWELKGRTWGIVGLGAIGRAVGAIAEAFGCRVQFFSTTGASSHDRWSAVDLATLLSTSDVVSVHAPLNELTLGLIGAEELGLLQPHAIILNL